MKLLVGLGNPGPEYEQTRHNIGFVCVDMLADRLGAPPFSPHKKTMALVTSAQINGEKVLLAKPQTFMNASGQSVALLMKYFNCTPESLIVVHDDLDLPFGEVKFQQGKGPKGHNGLLSIEDHIGTHVFDRIRIGVDSRSAEQRHHMSGRDYVLVRMSAQEVQELESTCEKIVAQGIVSISG